MTMSTEPDLGIPHFLDSPSGESESPKEGAANFPYCSVQQLNSMLERVATEGVPRTFDGSFFAKTSGSVAAQNRQALRFFDLMDEERRPTERMRTFAASSGEDRLSMMKSLFEERYGEALELAQHNGTRQELEATFRARGLNGATVDKAVTFYLGMCDQLGLSVSPYFKSGRRSSTNGGPKMASRRRPGSTSQQRTPAAPTAAPATSVIVTPEAQQRAAYVELLMDLVKTKAAADEPHVQMELLDRLERAIGVAKPTPPPGEGGG
jgi:hypothetical protein